MRTGTRFRPQDVSANEVLLSAISYTSGAGSACLTGATGLVAQDKRDNSKSKFTHVGFLATASWALIVRRTSMAIFLKLCRLGEVRGGNSTERYVINVLQGETNTRLLLCLLLFARYNRRRGEIERYFNRCYNQSLNPPKTRAGRSCKRRLFSAEEKPRKRHVVT